MGRKLYKSGITVISIVLVAAIVLSLLADESTVSTDAASVTSSPTYESAAIAYEESACVLFVDETAFLVNETASFSLTVYTTADAEQVSVRSDEADMMFTLDFVEFQSDGRAVYSGTGTFITDTAQNIDIYAQADSYTSDIVTLRFTPQVTEEMMDVLFAVAADISEAVQEKFGEEGGEETFSYVYDLLCGDSRILEVVQQESYVAYLTVDHLYGTYMLAPEEGVYGTGLAPVYSTFEQTGEAVSAFETVYVSGETKTATCSDLYLLNSYTITNSNVLFLQSNKGLSGLWWDYQEDPCQEFAEEIGGTCTIKRSLKFYEALKNGELCDYGTIVINAHGVVSPDWTIYQRSDGTMTVPILLWSTEVTDMKESLEYLMSTDDYNCLYSPDINNDWALLHISVDDSGTVHLVVTTDYIMQVYSDRVFDNTIFYLSICYELKDARFINFLLNHGAQAIVGSEGTISNLSDSNLFPAFLEALVEESETTDCYNSILEAWDSVNAYWGTEWTLVYVNNSSFTYYGDGGLSGYVYDESGSVEDVVLYAYQWENHQFKRRAVTVTESDGKFALPSLQWGIYVIMASYDGATIEALAQINLHSESKNGGIIYLSDNVSANTVVHVTDETTGDGIAGATIYMSPSLLITEYETFYTDSDGYCTFDSDLDDLPSYPLTDYIAVVYNDKICYVGAVKGYLNGDTDAEINEIQIDPTNQLKEIGTAFGNLFSDLWEQYQQDQQEVEDTTADPLEAKIASLVDEYGIIATGTENYDVNFTTDGYREAFSSQRITGLLCADIYDYDSDGTDELMVLRVDPGSFAAGDLDYASTNLIVSVYEPSDTEAVLADEKEMTLYCGIAWSYTSNAFSLFRYASSPGDDYQPADEEYPVWLALDYLYYANTSSQLSYGIVALSYDGETLSLADGIESIEVPAENYVAMYMAKNDKALTNLTGRIARNGYTGWYNGVEDNGDQFYDYDFQSSASGEFADYAEYREIHYELLLIRFGLIEETFRSNYGDMNFSSVSGLTEIIGLSPSGLYRSNASSENGITELCSIQAPWFQSGIMLTCEDNTGLLDGYRY